MNSTIQDYHDPVVALLRQEFLSDAAERIDVINGALESVNGRGAGRGGDGLLTIRREAHNLKGMGGSFDFPVVSLIARRLEDYIVGLEALHETHTAEIRVFTGHLRDIIDSGRDLDGDAAAFLLRNLPIHHGPGTEHLEGHKVEVLLVSPSLAVSQITAHALRTLGCRVTTVGSAAEAIEIAARTRPDLVLTSAVMDGVSGTDLVRALAAMTATESLPSAVLTSFSKEHHELQNLPAEASVIRLGDALGEDLARVIAKCNYVRA
jgi:CheY-like chemotaxis protein